MKSGGSKQKGAAFERRICRALSLWISEGKEEDLFWRSAMSGGRATLMTKKGKGASAQAGDISAIHPAAHVLTEHFVIECKHYANLHLQNLVYGGKGGIVEFWKQVCRDAKRNDKSPMLIAKQNRCPEIICLTFNSDQWIETAYDPMLISPPLKHNMVIYLLKDFLSNAKVHNAFNR